MESNGWRQAAARTALKRLLPRMENKAASRLPGRARWSQFTSRLEREWPRLFAHLHDLYGWQYDFFYTLERVLELLVESWLARPEALRRHDSVITGRSIRTWEPWRSFAIWPPFCASAAFP